MGRKELKVLLDEYIAEHFKDDESAEEFFAEERLCEEIFADDEPFSCDELFRDEKFRDDYHGIDKYFATELKKILSECIDEYIDKFIRRDNPDEEKIYSDFLKWRLDEYIYGITGCKFDAEYPDNEETQESPSFRGIINLRLPIYLSLFKAHFWFYELHFLNHEWPGQLERFELLERRKGELLERERLELLERREREQLERERLERRKLLEQLERKPFFRDINFWQTKNFWIETDFPRDEFALYRTATRALSTLHRHNYVGFLAAINTYLAAKQSDKTFSKMLVGLIGNNNIFAICDKANVSRPRYYEIEKDPLYHPKKITVVSFALALKLDIPTTKRLLNSAGYPMTNGIAKLIRQNLRPQTQTFSEMLLRLIAAGGESEPAIYKRANVDGRRFQRIKKNINYQPNKKIIKGFALALKLDLQTTEKFYFVANYPPVLHIAKYKKDLEKLLNAKPNQTFSEMLLSLIAAGDEPASAIYTRANITPQVFSRIKKNSAYQPKKDTAVAFALALKLDLPNAEKLLAAAGFILSESIRQDVIVSFFFENPKLANGDLDFINDKLFEYNCPCL